MPTVCPPLERALLSLSVSFVAPRRATRIPCGNSLFFFYPELRHSTPHSIYAFWHLPHGFVHAFSVLEGLGPCHFDTSGLKTLQQDRARALPGKKSATLGLKGAVKKHKRAPRVRKAVGKQKIFDPRHAVKAQLAKDEDVRRPPLFSCIWVPG